MEESGNDVSTADLFMDCFSSISNAKASLRRMSFKTSSSLRGAGTMRDHSNKATAEVSAENPRKSYLYSDDDDDDDEEEEEEDHEGKRMERKKKSFLYSDDEYSGDDTAGEEEKAVTQLDEASNDEQARMAFVEFSGCIMRWKGQREDKGVDMSSADENFANYLTDKFLCGHLDGLAKSTTVSAVRRKMAIKIEDIARGRFGENETPDNHDHGQERRDKMQEKFKSEVAAARAATERWEKSKAEKKEAEKKSESVRRRLKM